MHITMIGTGYVGLVSGVCFAELGAEVVCVDQDKAKIASLEAGLSPIYEPGLEAMMAANVSAGRLSFTTGLKRSVMSADAVFIAVGTPPRPEDGHADLSFVHQAARDIAGALSPMRRTVVVTKSTVPVGTNREIAAIIREENPHASFEVASNPEFLREGCAIEDFLGPDRVVIGCDSDHARHVMDEVYRPLLETGRPALFTSIESAELIKYSSNAFLAVKISFINQVADLCEKVGADIHEVARGMGLDTRIGPKFLKPGPGYGGSCFPKDTLAMLTTGQSVGSPLTIVEAAASANQLRKQDIATRIEAAAGGLEGKTVAILGVAFKADTDDMRDAPALTIIPRLQAAGAAIRAYDPAAMGNASRLLGGVYWAGDAYDAAFDADILVVMTEWNEFRALDLERVKFQMNGATLLDLRNLLHPEEAGRAGLVYRGIGMAPANMAANQAVGIGIQIQEPA